MNKSKSPIPTTKWGTACAQCAAAKAKCSRQSDKAPGAKCDRCERLLKTCTEQVQRPRKPRQVRTRKESTVSSSCGDTCGSLLPHAPSTSSTAPMLATSSSNFTPDIHVPFQLQQSPSRSATSSPSLPVSLSPPPPSSVHRTSVPPTSIDNFNRPRSPSNPTLDEDALATYVTQIQPTFPFILVPSNVNSQALAVERPLLMGAVKIAAATCTSTQISTSSTSGTSTAKVPESTLRKQVYQFVNTVSNSVMLRGEANLETLMAVVIVLGRWRWWCARHGGGLRFNTLLGVAEGLVGDLGLHRPSRQGQEEDMERVTDDEKRLLLGVWYLRSCAAMNLSQLSPTDFLPYMQQCLDDLEMSSYQSDRVLVQAIKVQHLEQRIARLNDELLANPGKDESVAIGRIVGLWTEWELLNRSWSSASKLVHNPLITSHLDTALLRLHDPLLAQSHPPTTTVLTHLYASALRVGIHFPLKPGTVAGAGTGAGTGTVAMIFQPFVDTWHSTTLSPVSGNSASGRLTALPTPIMAMHLAYFASLLLRVCFSLRSPPAFAGTGVDVQDMGLGDSIKEQLPLLGVVVGREFMALLLAVAESVTEASASPSIATGETLAQGPARITSILSTPSAFYPLVLGKWVSFGINGGVLPSGSSSSITAPGPGSVAMSMVMSSPTSHPGLSSPPNPTFLSVSAAGSPFPTTDSEYEDYELDFDVDVDMALPGVSGPHQGVQYGHGGGYHQHQGLASGYEHHQPQMHGQGQGQQWSVGSTAGGWPVSSPEDSMSVAAAMFWGQGHGGVQQGHSQGQHQGQGGWGPGR